MCEPFFKLWSNTTASSAELRGSIWRRNRDAQNETVCEPGASDRWRIQNSGLLRGKSDFLQSCLCFIDHFVSFSYLIFQVFLWLPVSMRPHYLSWSAASHLINEQILVFSPGLVWHKNHSTWDFIFFYVFILWRFDSYGIQNLTKNFFLFFWY